MLRLFLGIFGEPESSKNIWLVLINVLFALFFVYGSIIFFRKNDNKYKYALTLISIFWLQTQATRFFFISKNGLEKDDVQNFISFAVVFSFVYLTKYLNKKYRYHKTYQK